MNHRTPRVKETLESQLHDNRTLSSFKLMRMMVAFITAAAAAVVVYVLLFLLLFLLLMLLLQLLLDCHCFLKPF